MSTPDSGAASSAAAAEALAATLAGLPDTAFLAHLANEMFKALPGSGTPPAGAGASFPSAPGFVSAGVQAPAVAPVPPVTPPTGAALPSVPGAVGGSAFPFAPPVTHGANPAGSPPPAQAFAPTQYAAPDLVPFAPLPAAGSLGTTAPEPRLPVPAPFGLQAEMLSLLPTHAAGLPSPSVAPSAADAVVGGGSGLYFLDNLAGGAPSVPAATDVPPFAASANNVTPPPQVVTRDSQPEPALGGRAFEAGIIKRDFPILQSQVNGRPLVWLDNAATTQKPQSVIDRLSYFYTHESSNIHRGAHTLAARATDAYEAARDKVRRFINAPSVDDIIFVRGTTEGINLIAQSWGRRNVREGDEIVVTHLEHHANIVPWQQLAAEKGAKLRVAPVDDSGQVILEEYEKLLNPRTRIVSFTHVSNALGTVTPAAEMIAMAHRHGARVLLDGAQSVSHMPIDVQALDPDFFVLSGHKMFAPTGIGAVYGKSDALQDMPPWQGGGNMIADVTFEKTVYQGPPARFEAGTGNIADAVGLGAAIDYLMDIGMATIAAHEHALIHYATDGLNTIPGLKIIGTAKEKAGAISFVLEGCPTEEVGKALARDGIAVRSGHHCAQPILRRFGLEATVRPSFALYNTTEDIDALVHSLQRIQAFRGIKH